MTYRIEAFCEDNHSWSFLSEDENPDPGMCPTCGAEPVGAGAHKVPDRVFFMIEPAMFFDKYTRKPMNEKSYFISLYRNGKEFLVRSPRPMSWPDSVSFMNTIKDYEIEKALRVWKVKFAE